MIIHAMGLYMIGKVRKACNIVNKHAEMHVCYPVEVYWGFYECTSLRMKGCGLQFCCCIFI